MISFLGSYLAGSRLHVPGTMEILLARHGGRFEANRIDEVIAYYALVCMMTARTVGGSKYLVILRTYICKAASSL